MRPENFHRSYNQQDTVYYTILWIFLFVFLSRMRMYVFLEHIFFLKFPLGKREFFLQNFRENISMVLFFPHITWFEYVGIEFPSPSVALITNEVTGGTTV